MDRYFFISTPGMSFFFDEFIMRMKIFTAEQCGGFHVFLFFFLIFHLPKILGVDLTDRID